MRRKSKKARKPEPAPLPRGTRSRVDLLCSEPIEMKHLKSAISLLTHSCREKTKKRKVQHCVIKKPQCDTKTRPNDFGIALRSRAARFIPQQIRHALLQRDWESAARLLHLFISTGVTLQTAYIARVCMVLLMNHPSSDSEMLFNFLRDVTLYENDEDLEKYAILMHTQRDKILQPIPVTSKDLRKHNWKLIEATELTTVELNVPLFQHRGDS